MIKCNFYVKVRFEEHVRVPYRMSPMLFQYHDKRKSQSCMPDEGLAQQLTDIPIGLAKYQED